MAGGPTVADLGEFGLIARAVHDRVQPATTLLGPGDDAAVVACGGAGVVASTDVLVEGVHFRLDWSGPEQVGRKAAAVNLADIAAMGATPTALLVGFGCPARTPAATAGAIIDGLWAEARAVGAGVVGGDVVSAPAVVLAVTALGALPGCAPVTRAGARPGDVLAVAGRLGWSAGGLAALSAGVAVPAQVLRAHQVPTPPYAAGPAAARAGATSMIDVSDGLLADVSHLAVASGVAVDIRTAALDVPAALAEAAAALGVDPLRWVLTGGEDHALVATFGPDRALPAGWTVIGSVRPARDGDQGGAGQVSVDGGSYDGVTGWDHFGPG